MPRTKRDAMPQMRRHNTGRFDRAFVTLNGERHYLGGWGTPEAQEAYDRLLNQWLAQGRRLLDTSAGITVTELCLAFLDYAERRFAHHQSGGHLDRIRLTIRTVRQLYGSTSAEDFGPKALRAVRQKWVEAKYSRSYINTLTGTARHIFKWGAGQELLPASVHHSLTMVEPLHYGFTEARESKPVQPVAEHDIEIVRGRVGRIVRAMIDLQLLTGARPGEVCGLRKRDIDTTGQDGVWIATLPAHKTRHKGKQRRLYLGPEAQEIVRPFLVRRDDDYLFSPQQAEAEHRAERHEQRKTPLSCGNVPGKRSTTKQDKGTGARKFKDHYTPAAYCRAVKRAAESYNYKKPDVEKIEEWTPNQLRHTRGTLIRQRYGLEGAQVYLGHSRADVTQVYAERDESLALRIAKEMG